jgi:hypothetical protein
LREWCLVVLGDVSAPDRKVVRVPLGQMRRADDLRNLREALVSVIWQLRGHGVARARAAPLDLWLRAAGGVVERRKAGGSRR